MYYTCITLARSDFLMEKEILEILKSLEDSLNRIENKMDKVADNLKDILLKCNN